MERLVFHLQECSLVVAALSALADAKGALCMEKTKHYFLVFTSCLTIKEGILSGCNGKILGES